MIYSLFARQLSIPQLDNEDLQQIDPDDLEEMELRKDTLQGSYDGLGYDWSDQAEEGLTNFALMAYSSSSINSEVSNDSNCCSSCLECVKDLKEQNEQLVKDLRTARISVVSYKTGLESVEARLLVFKKNESVYEEDIKLLKREIYLRDLDITELKRKLELATKEKDEVQLTVQKFENSSKNLSKLLDRQIMDKCKTGLGYNVVPPPYTGNFMPPKSDLVYPSLDDFVDVNESVNSDKGNVTKVKIVEMFNKPSFAKINFVKSTKQVKSPRKTSVDKNRQNTPSPKGNKRNWNQQMAIHNYEEIDGGFVAFGGNSKGGKITWKDLSFSSSLKDSPNAGFKPLEEEEKKGAEYPGNEGGNPTEEALEDNAIDENRVYGCADDPSIPNLEEIGRFSDAKDDGVGLDYD
ncbi:hypothetical protein Tco_0019798 [Tanacetum coccineum]